MLKSVVVQTYKNLEIVLIDDGSKDASGMICDMWAEKDSRIKCYHQQNSGVSNARNYGFSKSSGDYIIFLDGDDEIAPDMCEKLLDKLITNYADVSYCGFYNIFSDKMEIQIPEDKILEGSDILHCLVTSGSFFTAIWNKMFRRDAVKDDEGNFIEFQQGIYVGEDGLWLSKVLKGVKKVVAVSEPLYYWKRRENSATQGDAKIRTDEKYLTVLKAYREMYFEIDDTETSKIMCKKYLGVSRDCMVQAYKEHNGDLVNVLRKSIEADKKLYHNIDFFFIKLELCILLIRLKAPIKIINRIQKA
jgi:glycosyltransferase involved in cell wall biosynthesis